VGWFRGLGIYGAIVATALLVVVTAALGVGDRGWLPTLVVMGTSLVFEALVGAAVAVPFGFHPVTGALLAAFTNLIPVPLLAIAYGEGIYQWTWLHQRVTKAEALSQKYSKYGMVGLALLTPVLGVYVTVAMAELAGFRRSKTFVSVVVSVVVSALIVSFCGAGVRAAILHFI
jgi:uncharacterized membrane protein